MKVVFKIIMYIIFLPILVIALIYFSMYCLIEMLCVKQYSYFKKNKLKLRNEYYYGILNDPIFHFKNIISKYDLDYNVIEVEDANNSLSHYLVINKNKEVIYTYIPTKKVYFENCQLYFQYLNDTDTSYNVEEYMQLIEKQEYSFNKNKLVF